MNDRSSLRTDYDEYAPTYAWARWAVRWVVSPLARIAHALPADAAVLEIGCGTGNYIRALAETRNDLVYAGFDLSEPMLQEARRWGSSVTFVHGDAGKEFPFPMKEFSLVRSRLTGEYRWMPSFWEGWKPSVRLRCASSPPKSMPPEWFGFEPRLREATSGFLATTSCATSVRSGLHNSSMTRKFS